MKECMVRLIYCEMLGYEASFGYIHAIKLAQQGNLFEKRVGRYFLEYGVHESPKRVWVVLRAQDYLGKAN